MTCFGDVEVPPGGWVASIAPNQLVWETHKAVNLMGYGCLYNILALDQTDPVDM